MQKYPRRATATIANAAALSNAFDARGMQHFSFSVPATMTNSTIGFTSAHNAGDTYKTLQDQDGTPISVTLDVSTNGAVTDDKALRALRSAGWLKITTPTNEGQETVIETMMTP
jgi:hypothetical protein